MISGESPYSEILDSIDAGGISPTERYDALARCFHDIIDEATAASSINFSGPFAKTDFLLREHNAPEALAEAVHRARRHIRRRMSLADEAKERFFASDLLAVRQLAALLAGRQASATPAKLSDTGTESRPTALRVIVVSKTDDSIVCRTDSDSATTLRLRLSLPQLYLADMVGSGTQLNLLDYAIDNAQAEVRADIIVYEPDFLINTTLVARCFESYGTDARIAIVLRMSPPANSEAIHLGNFASQLLDEAVHGGSRAYNDSVKAYFTNNAVQLAGCGVSPSFHTDARRQQDNIAAALQKHLPAEVGDFDPLNMMVEPVFFSESLGLQGRMDLLQLDYRLILEQKSGKGEWPDGNDGTPRQRLQHYVQLLLYMGIIRYNYKDIFEANGSRLSAFLLYSRYRRPLVSPGFAPSLFIEAIDVRNRIVWYHERIASGDTDFLKNLQPTDLLQRPADRLWERYTLPTLESLLNPRALADDTVSAYYYRMLSFVSLEHTHAKTENKAKAVSGFAALWHNSLSEKLEAGNIFAGLHLKSPGPDRQGRVDNLIMTFADDRNHHMANFRAGDAVIAYSYDPGSEPDARRSMVFRCSISDIGPDSISLALRFPQSGVLPFIRAAGCLWAIEHDFIDSSFNALYQGIQAFTHMPAERCDLLLMRREPRIDTGRRLRLDHGSFNNLALRVKQAQELYLIVGPPGTGKTSYGLMTTLKEELAEDTPGILLLSYTNRAVDEICSKLAEEGIDFLRIGPEGGCASAYRDNLLCKRAAACRNICEVRDLICNTRIVAATVSALNSGIGILGMRAFSLAIIDEASQILEPYLLGILSATYIGKPSIGKIVMIGDHKQLPAVVQQTPAQSSVDNPLLREIGLDNCRNSLFERLLHRYGSTDAVSFMLTRQGRMHAEVADFASKTFYGGRLVPVPLPHQTLPLTPTDDTFGHGRMIFIDVAEIPLPDVSDKVNTREAEVIADIACEVYSREETFDENTLGIIVPYRSQIAAVRHALAAKGIEAFDRITVDTVERYQGSQRKYIVYGFTAKHPRQLKFLTDNTFTDIDGTVVDRKLNVALTRAREYMVLTGNASLLRAEPVFAALIDYIKERGGYI